MASATPTSAPAPNPQYRTMHVNPRLPLIEGVLPLDNSAERIIEEALRTEEAAIVLQRNHNFSKLNPSSTSVRPPLAKKRRVDKECKKLPQRQPRHQQHWLWRAMASYNVTERRAVTAFLLQQTGLNEYQRHGLVQQIVRMLKYYAHARQTAPPLIRSRWTLEWISLLETFLFHNDAFVNTMSLHWKWLAQTLWEVAVVPADSNVDAEQMAALVHLIYSMTLTYSVSAVGNEEPSTSPDTTTTPPGLLARNSKLLWTDRNTFPLAVLIAAYHKHCVGPTCQGHVLSVELLGRLIDPRSHPHVVMTTVKQDVASPEISSPDAQIMMDLEEDEDIVVEENVEVENKESPRKDSEVSQESSIPLEHKEDEDEDEEDEEEEDDDEDDHHRTIPDEDDEDIDTGDEDDDENENNENDGDDDEMDVVREDEMSHFEHVLGGLDVEDAQVDVDLDHISEEPTAHETKARSTPSSSALVPSVPEREVLYVRAGMQVLSEQYPHVHSPTGAARNELLSLAAENSLLDAINQIVKPPQKPLNTRIVMRRAPTQEEFFRGSLARNPITANMLKPCSGVSAGEVADPTIGDLRQHIADGLQMSDSAELIEIIVANKILDVNLKIRVVHDVLWRKHLMENSQSSSTGYPARSFFSAGAGISMILSSDFGERSSGARRGITTDTPASALPPLVVTYRLAGVDGEATEDTVNVGDLIDPQAPSECTSPQELEMLLEKEYGNTRMVTEGRGVAVLLRSVQFVVCDTLRKVRRDDLLNSNVNQSRETFKQSPPCPALLLLMHCSKLPINRKKLLQARAPTILLSLLMDVLKTLEGGSVRAAEVVKSNPTAKTLQELIESLTSDISATGSADAAEADGYESDVIYDTSSMSLLLESIETISLSPPLRSVIAKLLPFLTYGQEDLCRELAKHFYRHLIVDELANFERESSLSNERSILLGTFVQTAISLPANEVCNSLRVELINCGLIDRVVTFVMKEIPKLPPTWSPALWVKGELPSTPDRNKRNTPSKKLEDQWMKFISRGGLRTAIKVLLGLSKAHCQTQIRICQNPDFVRSMHWLEATSDNTQVHVCMDGLGLLAETLLDEIAGGSDEMKKVVTNVRAQTRERKKEMAQERRAKALAKMTKFGGLPTKGDPTPVPQATGVRGATASILAPVLGFFRDSNPSESCSGQAPSGINNTSAAAKPSWLAEAEMIEDEDGLTCAVCQEGRTLQPSELLGLYAYVKKVTLPIETCGFSAEIEGWALLKSLPPELPGILPGKKHVKEWFLVGKAAGDALDDPPLRASAKRKSEVFTTTVSAGNAIHLTCHQKARQADRNHPKAPKSEWEGAALRNNRVSCNVILPLVSSKSSKVPLMAVDSALSDHQTAVANLLGSNPRSLLWTVLHDVRLLMLRIAYGESLNSDCGGGSLISNCQLIFYQLQLADTFDKDAQADQPEKSQHAHCLSSGFLAACAIISQGDMTPALNRGAAESSILSSVTAILFHNSNAEGEKDAPSEKLEATKPHPKRRWAVAKDYFLRGLLLYAGRRKALGVLSSGCQTLSGRKRSSSFAEWDEGSVDTSRGLSRSFASNRRSTKPSVQDFQNVLRPMVTMYALLDQLSDEFVVCMEDRNIEESAQRLARKVEECQRATNILDLLKKAKVTVEHGDMLEWVQKGMAFAL